MAYSLDPRLLKDLTEAKAALARHGIVIIRTIEIKLEPVIMSEVKSSIASSPKKMSQMGEDDLDKLLETLRKVTTKETSELMNLYVRLLAKLGAEDLGDLVRELDGIGQLFTWQRIARSVESVNHKLKESGFPPIELHSPDDLSDGFEVELEQKWPAALERFKSLAAEASGAMEGQQAGGALSASSRKTKKNSKKG